MHTVPDELVRRRRGEGFETCHLVILLGIVTYKINNFLIQFTLLSTVRLMKLNG